MVNDSVHIEHWFST